MHSLQACPTHFYEYPREGDRLREHHAEWFAEYETLDPMKAPREACETLLCSAPTECSRGLIAGILVMRSEMEAFAAAVPEAVRYRRLQRPSPVPARRR